MDKQYLEGLKIPNEIRFVKLQVWDRELLLWADACYFKEYSDMGRKEWKGEKRLGNLLHLEVLWIGKEFETFLISF